MTEKYTQKEKLIDFVRAWHVQKIKRYFIENSLYYLCITTAVETRPVN